jgi:deoxyribodipyrimidine photo-lyase
MAVCKIWWVRRDLRLDDNAALARAASGADALVPVFVAGDADEGAWPLGGAQRWWLARSLKAHAAKLEALGSRLVIVEGEAAPVIADLAKRLGATEVVWSRRFDPAGLAAERRVEAALDRLGIAWSGQLSNHLFDPEEVATKEGRPYQVYTPFSRNCRARPAPSKPRATPTALPLADGAPKGTSVDALGLEPTIDWAGGLRAMWTPGEDTARTRLAAFSAGALARYPVGRDEPAADGSSLIAPHLAFGEVGIRRVWHTAAASRTSPEESTDKFHAELLWREFATHVLYHFPKTDHQPLRPDFARFPWRNDADALERWRRGRTGYPLVDAGMRQLWHTGWMHNRVRMVVASFLVKHLLLPWQDGAKWFWDTLVDADLANNSLGWQWAAGCGADAAPYFRIFNPTSQAQKFDPAAAYIKRWVPELASVPAKDAVAPIAASLLPGLGGKSAAGAGYPLPMIDHGEARARALAALASISRGKAGAETA